MSAVTETRPVKAAVRINRWRRRVSVSLERSAATEVISWSLQAFVISFTSEFVPRMVYQYMYSANGTMNGYTEHSLSYFNVSNFPSGSAPTSTLITGVSMCRSELTLTLTPPDFPLKSLIPSA